MMTSNLTPELSLPVANLVIFVVGALLVWYFVKDVILSEYRVRIYNQCGTRSHSLFVISNCIYLVSGMTLLGLSTKGIVRDEAVDYNTLIVWFSAAVVALIIRVRESDKLDCKLSYLDNKCQTCPTRHNNMNN